MPTVPASSSSTSPSIFTDDDRLRYGGDWSVLRTVPANGIHPDRNIAAKTRLPGTRASISGGENQVHTFLRGDIIAVDDPTGDYCFITWNDNGTDGPGGSRNFWMLLKRRGYNLCLADQWELSPDMRDIWEVVDNNYVLSGGAPIPSGTGVKPVYERLMWCTRARFEVEQAKLNVAPTPEGSNWNPTGNQSGEIGATLHRPLKSNDPNVAVMTPQIEAIEHRWTPPS